MIVGNAEFTAVSREKCDCPSVVVHLGDYVVPIPSRQDNCIILSSFSTWWRCQSFRSSGAVSGSQRTEADSTTDDSIRVAVSLAALELKLPACIVGEAECA